MLRIQRNAAGITTLRYARTFKPLLVGVVAGFAKRLQFAVPKSVGIVAMRFNVICYGGRYRPAL